MTVEQIGGTSYRITLTVDEDFLQNAFYPVTVDPTLTVTHVDNSIIDAPIFEGIPNTNFGTFQYNNVGNAGGSYGSSIVQQPISGSDMQKWELTYSSKGEYYTIESVEADGYYLAITQGVSANTAPAILTSGSTTQYARWVIEETASGAYTLETLAHGESHGVVLTVDPFNEASNGAVLQQRTYSDDSNYRDEWEFGLWEEPNINLAPQESNVWCWVASAHMFASNYLSEEITMTQAQVSKAVHGIDGPISGSFLDTKSAIEIYMNIYDSNQSEIVLACNDGVYTEETILQFLNDGHVLLMFYRDSGGHAAVVCGYVSIGEDRYFVEYDPWPVDIGEINLYTYEDLCNHYHDGLDQTYEWIHTITIATTYSIDNFD